MRLPKLPTGIAQSDDAANVYQNDLNRYLAQRERDTPPVTSGMWTPTLVSLAGTNPTCTYSAATRGRWVRTGPMVYVTGGLILASRSGGTGQACIGGLPFLCVNDSGGRGTLDIGFASGFSSTTTPRGAVPEKALNVATLWRSASADERDALATAVLVTDCGASAALLFSGLYFVQ